MRFKKLYQNFSNFIIKWWFPLGLFFHIAAAYFSTGFYHVDEHYQILEFLHNKLHLTNPITYPWEFAEKMRPWLQPFTYYLITKALTLINITNPFTLVFVFRLLSALIGFFSICLWVRYIKENYTNQTSVFVGIISLNFLWFTPYLHARISGEALGASVLSIGLYFILNAIKSDKILTYFISGFILGLSVILRYHIAFIIISLMAWLVIILKIRIKNLTILSLGLLGALGISLFVDYWGYREWTLAPLNYFNSNIVNDKASEFGIFPWYEYFIFTLHKTFAPIGLVILGAWGAFCYLKPKHLITWLSIPFFLLHVLVPHKELRFLFPLTAFIPIIFVILSDEYQSQLTNFLKFKITKIVITFIVLSNAFLLGFNTFLRAHPSEGFYKNLFSQNNTNRTYVLLDDDSFFHPGIYSNNFYNENHENIMKLKGSDTLKNADELKDVWFISWNKKTYLDLMANKDCAIEYKSQPNWYIDLPLKETKIWAITRCNKKVFLSSTKDPSNSQSPAYATSPK